MTTKVQRIQRVGNSSGILLPKEWLRAKGLKPGSRVRLEISDTRLVILTEEKEREIPVDARFARDVNRFLRKHRRILARLS